MKSKSESRIIITGLSADQALELANDLKESTKISAKQIEVDHPGPPPLFEKEYNTIEACFQELDEATSEGGGYEHATTLKEVQRDVKHMLKAESLIVKRLQPLRRAIAELVKLAGD